MSKASTPEMSKEDAYEAFRAGELSKADATRFFGCEWDDVLQLSRVEDVLNQQPKPDIPDDDLYR